MGLLQQSRPGAEANSAGLIGANRSAGMKILLAVFMVLIMGSFSSSQQLQPPADVIFVNGDIYPAAHTSFVWASASEKPHLPGRASALAVANGKVVAIGSKDELQKP